MNFSRLSWLGVSILLACSSEGSPGPGGSGGAATTGMPDVGSGGTVTGGQSGASGGSETATTGGASGATTGSGGAQVGSGGGGGDITPASGGSSTMTDCSSMHRCDDFESATVGAAPDAGSWSVELGYSNDQATASNVQISSEDAHSGSNSLKIQDAMSGPYNIYTAPPAPAFYTRAWFKMTASTADENGSLTAIGSDHNSTEIRFRKHLGTSTINSAMGDGLSPDPFNCTDACVPTPAGTWFCAEMFYDGPNESATLWIDGVLAAKIENNMGWHSQSPGGFEDPPLKVWFGTMWHQGSAPVTYIDDVAIHTSRIGCE